MNCTFKFQQITPKDGASKLCKINNKNCQSLLKFVNIYYYVKVCSETVCHNNPLLKQYIIRLIEILKGANSNTSVQSTILDHKGARSSGQAGVSSFTSPEDLLSSGSGWATGGVGAAGGVGAGAAAGAVDAVDTGTTGGICSTGRGGSYGAG